MNFFEAQDSARARTRTLVLLFIGAVAAIVIAVYVVAHIGLTTPGTPFNPVIFAVVAFATSGLIALGSLFRTLQLRKGGGTRVAEMLGGQRVRPNTSDEGERRFINVVEEMSLASGTPVPAMYVLQNESGINAFAAGYTVDDAAVAVSRGAIDTLTRDELQGVVAHEFSHILNGDMRLNIRLMGLLFGILLLAVVGRGLLRGGSMGRRSSREKGGGGQIALFGLGLMLVGYIGVFFGRLIQAAVSRQREYLADAAAVQFTRNPVGIAGALKKISTVAGSRIENHHAQEAGHLFFATGLKQSLFSLLATHPPIDDRIRRLDASYDTSSLAEAEPARAAVAGAPVSSFSGSSGIGSTELIASIGAPQPQHVAYARHLLASLPGTVTAAAHDRDGAAALLFALLLHDDGAHDETQHAALRAHGGEPLVVRTQSLLRDIAPLGRSARLPLLDLLLPSFAEIARAEMKRIYATAQALIAADSRMDVFELALFHLLGRQVTALDPDHKAVSAAATTVRSLAEVRAECQVVLSAIAWAGASDDAAATAAFAAAAADLPKLPNLVLERRDALSIPSLNQAFDRLRSATPALRRAVLAACTQAVAHDARVDVQEAELLRAVAEAIHLPLPPVVASAPRLTPA